MLVNTIILLIALLHLYFLWFEMFAWTTKGRKIFRNFPSELFEPTKSMAANQGLYNAFWPLVWYGPSLFHHKNGDGTFLFSF